MGLQWGDEGKGKLVDALAGEVDIVVRAQGGANAGHTVISDGQAQVLHLLPSGMLYPEVRGIVGNGVVVDPLQLVIEMRELGAAGHDVRGRLHLSDRAHLVLPYHPALDHAMELLRGEDAIGTTGRGIGPAYMDKAARSGIRAGEMRDRDHFGTRVRTEVADKNRLLAAAGAEPLDARAVLDSLEEAREELLPYIADTVSLLHREIDGGAAVLLEGAQGALLDLDLGTYPYVTSSNCHVGGLLAGSGLAPRLLGGIVGVCKAYCTRVGSGPFPTEEDGEVGEFLRRRGVEFGATTGRPRRCGWFDAVAVRFAVRTNGVSEIALTKVDVLEGLDEIKVCTGYRIDGELTRDLPAGSALERVEPVYVRLPGFSTPIRRDAGAEGLPAELDALVELIESECGAAVSLVSTGPERSHTVVRGDGR
jgi:adenylosuccinate synthase